MIKDNTSRRIFYLWAWIFGSITSVWLSKSGVFFLITTFLVFGMALIDEFYLKDKKQVT